MKNQTLNKTGLGANSYFQGCKVPSKYNNKKDLEWLRHPYFALLLLSHETH